jgi:hypothetical protein
MLFFVKASPAMCMVQLLKNQNSSVADPVPPDPHVFGLLDPDPPVRGMDLDPSIIMQKK